MVSMKTFARVITVLAAMALLISCSSSPATSSRATQPATTLTTTITPAEKTQGISASPTESETPVLTPTPTPIPLPTTNIIQGLPDPGLWVPSLRLDPKEYPRVDGSTANIPLGVYMRALITGQTLLECEFTTSFTTTGPSYLALASGKADLLVVYEAPNEIKTKLESMGAKLIIMPIGLDALVFLANKGNPVKNLTHGQIVGIYAGKIKKWNQVGGENIDIIPYQRISNSGSQALMLKLVMKGTKMMEAPAILEPSEMGDLVDAIASYDNTGNALGYSVYYYVRNMYQVPGIKLLSVNGVTPDAKTIASGKYPYINPFYAVIREDEPAGSPARKLFDWLTGAEGKRAVQDAGYVAAN